MRKPKFNLSISDLARSIQSLDQSVSLYIILLSIWICKAERDLRAWGIKLWRNLKSSAVKCTRDTKPTEAKGQTNA
jgi:hypothetical protein